MKNIFRSFILLLCATLLIMGGCGDSDSDDDGNNTMDGSTPSMLVDDNWGIVSAGGRHNLALKSDGSLWAWGTNYYGALGDGTTERKRSPKAARALPTP